MRTERIRYVILLYYFILLRLFFPYIHMIPLSLLLFVLHSLFSFYSSSLVICPSSFSCLMRI
ncbi:hypothetical protein CSUI_005499 [Cystoisospora suis]|uniref:Transmembrane protein n=1 Tax=Cystoisospora suis TaxID=483139 RepID=A0A2C6KXS4_9APIC|nr:hypothetical protein CSUI_005499 [Cystoisospora suis]